MRYLAISGEDSSTYLLVCDKSCFVHSKSVHVLLAQARPAMINHHTSCSKLCDFGGSLRVDMSESVERNNYAHPVVVTKEYWQGRDMYVWLECVHLSCDCHVASTWSTSSQMMLQLVKVCWRHCSQTSPCNADVCRCEYCC